MADAKFFTVFTPTFNRAHTLSRVFDSLCAQNWRDFEWLIVDDGSTDNTADVVAEWRRIATFPIRYLRQDNAGKHIAHNRAVREARGDFIVIIDSDDALAANALERLQAVWNSIPAGERVGFSGVSGLCRNQHGEIIGDPYPDDPFDASPREHVYVHRLRGERCGMVRTDILRRYPFPEIANTRFVPEDVVWMDMARHYKQRAVNEVFRIYYVDDTATGSTLTRRRNLRADAAGRMYYYVWLLNNDIGYLFKRPDIFLKAAIMLPIVGRHMGRSLSQIMRDLRNMVARGLVLGAFPVSFIYFLIEQVANGWSSKR
jgi:glycosyltransferase involved in cell wall biosynthesis